MNEQITVAARPRDERGKNAARRLRRNGQIPAVLYGGGDPTLAISLDPVEIRQILHSPSGHNTLFTLAVEGGASCRAMLRDWTRDPLKENLLHVDLIRIGAKTRLKVKVPIHTKGDPKGVKLEGGIFSFILREVEVECLPEDIPEEIQVDIRELMVGDGVRVGDLLLGEKVKLETDPRRIVLHVVAPRVEEEKLAEEEVAADATAEEPELIRKQKAAEEGEGEGDSEGGGSEKKA